MKAVIYIRVSTAEQNTDNQLPTLEAMAANRAYSVVSTYRENETAWHAGHQKELARLLVEARRGKFQILLVWALDRLTRQGSLAILELINKLKTYGVKVISYEEPWTDAPGELGELLYAMTGWIAAFESKRRSARTIEGLNRAKKNGHKLATRGKDKKKRLKRGALVYT
tara:strand:- start:467 stop:973 length:507 start_codon:yes stop_codon:yes gene_type:complete